LSFYHLLPFYITSPSQETSCVYNKRRSLTSSIMPILLT
jgi:hypothetical protein